MADEEEFSGQTESDEIEKLELPKTDAWGLPLRETLPQRRRKPLTKEQKIEYALKMQEMGMDRAEADLWQYAIISSMGLEIQDGLSKTKANEIICRLREREPVEQVAAKCLSYQSERSMMAGEADGPETVVHTAWTLSGVSPKQIGLMRYRGVPHEKVRCRRDASLLLDAALKPETFKGRLLKDITRAKSDGDLNGIGKDLALVDGVLEKRIWLALAEAGRERRKQLKPRSLPQ